VAEVELSVDFEKLLEFGRNALEKERYLICVQNYNEALSICETPEQKRRVYLALSDLYMKVGNGTFARYALFMSEKVSEKGGYDGIDYPRFFPELTEEQEEEGVTLTAEQILAYNKAYSLILEKKYAKAVKILLQLPASIEYLESIAEAFEIAVDADEKFRAEDFLMPLLLNDKLCLFEPKVIRLFLRSGNPMKLFVTESISYLLDANNVIREYLVDIGEILFESGEFATAKKFFEKVLSACPIDEVSLYYCLAIAYAENDGERIEKYKGIYYEAFRCGNPPMDALSWAAQDAVTSDNPPYYLEISHSLEKEWLDVLPSVKSKTDIDEEGSKAIFRFCAFAQPLEANLYLQEVTNRLAEKPVLTELLLSMAYSPYITKPIKDEILHILLREGYEGKFAYNTPTKGVLCDVTSLHRRVCFAWKEVYKSLQYDILTGTTAIPMRCNVLNSVVTKCYQVIGNVEDDKFMACYDIVLCNYVKWLGINVDYVDVFQDMNIDVEMLKNDMQELNLESPFV